MNFLSTKYSQSRITGFWDTRTPRGGICCRWYGSKIRWVHLFECRSYMRGPVTVKFQVALDSDKRLTQGIIGGHAGNYTGSTIRSLTVQDAAKKQPTFAMERNTGGDKLTRDGRRSLGKDKEEEDTWDELQVEHSVGGDNPSGWNMQGRYEPKTGRNPVLKRLI
ncbi:hypothetical protein B0H19DRAFT_1082752 [Mycena capillaripes]|nr:hypothetical protein B0H19DRAFT_1082752 [Mycena capillaripes]